MDHRYSIDEILLAVNEIQNKEKEKKILSIKINPYQKIIQKFHWIP